MTLILLALLACTRGPPLRDGGVEAPSPVSGPLVRFIALGDAGEDNVPHYRNALAIRDHCAAKTDERGPGCHFVAYLGDNFYPVGVSGPDDEQWDTKWADPYRELGVPFYAVLGNHDYGDPPFDRERALAQVDAAAVIEGFHLPAPWYGFDAGPARFLALDSHAVMMGWTDEQQGAWVDAQLAASDRPWTVLLAHHPFRSNGVHGNAGEYEGTRHLPIASGAAVEAFYRQHVIGKVDLVLSGHDHNRQWLEPVQGTELVVSGAGSKAVPLADRGSPTLFQEDRERGFTWFELDGDTLRGEVVDEWSRLDFERQVPRRP